MKFAFQKLTSLHNENVIQFLTSGRKILQKECNMSRNSRLQGAPTSEQAPTLHTIFFSFSLLCGAIW